MMRLRIASVAVGVCVAFGAAAVPAVAASNGFGSPTNAYRFSALYTLPVTGVTKTGDKQFKGTFGIQRFVASGGKAWAVGTLKGTVAGRHVTRYGVRLPANLTGPSSSSSNPSARAAASCPVLNLVLGPINLNLLGLEVHLGGGSSPTSNLPINLNITAVSGTGNLLGNLLCDVSNLLNPSGGSTLSGLTGSVQQLTAVLNGILGDLSGAGL
jgi:hypothetical protein